MKDKIKNIYSRIAEQQVQVCKEDDGNGDGEMGEQNVYALCILHNYTHKQ